VLAWSRVRFVRFAADERSETTLAMLAECFEALDGVPGKVLADRMGCLKGGVVANVVVPTAEYVRFASHYGFRPDFCEAADPESKGIAGNLVGYAAADLMAPRPAPVAQRPRAGAPIPARGAPDVSGYPRPASTACHSPMLTGSRHHPCNHATCNAAHRPQGKSSPTDNRAFFLVTGLPSRSRPTSAPGHANQLRTGVRHLMPPPLLYFAAVLAAQAFELCL
jgi:hypothetical protein